MISWHKFLHDSVWGTICTPNHQLPTNRVQKSGETALDTQKNEGTESSFPVKMHLIVLHKAWPSVKSLGFTDEAVKMTVSSVKTCLFTDDLKNLVLIAHFGTTTMLQTLKEKSQIIDF